MVIAGVVTQVNDNEMVCASGAEPPADGKIGCTVNVNNAPVLDVNKTDNGVFGALDAAVHKASANESVTPQSASISTAKVPCESVV